jgi:hypothetical protein
MTTRRPRTSMPPTLGAPLVALALTGCALDLQDHPGQCVTKELPTGFDGEDLELLRGYTRVGGDLVVPRDAEDLSALGCLEQVDGTLEISGVVALDSLAGLENLRSAGQLRLDELPQLESTAAVAGLRELTGEGLVDVLAWPTLERWESSLGVAEISTIDLYGLPPTAEVTAFVELERCAALTILSEAVGDSAAGARVSLDGLVSAEILDLEGIAPDTLASLQQLTAGDFLEVVGFGGEDLTGLSSLQAIGSLQVRSSPSLRSLHGLEALASVGELELVDNVALVDITALGQVRAMPPWRDLGGTLSMPRIHIGGSPQLADLSPLAGITEDTLGTIALTDLPAVTALPTLAGLRTLGALGLVRTGVVDLDALADVDALRLYYFDTTDTKSPGSSFSITLVENPALTDLSGLASVVDVGDRGDLEVVDNAQLATCAVEAMVTTLDAAGRDDGTVDIAGNDDAAGC